MGILKLAIRKIDFILNFRLVRDCSEWFGMVQILFKNFESKCLKWFETCRDL